VRSPSGSWSARHGRWPARGPSPSAELQQTAAAAGTGWLCPHSFQPFPDPFSERCLAHHSSGDGLTGTSSLPWTVLRVCMQLSTWDLYLRDYFRAFWCTSGRQSYLEVPQCRASVNFIQREPCHLSLNAGNATHVMVLSFLRVLHAALVKNCLR